MGLTVSISMQAIDNLRLLKVVFPTHRDCDNIAASQSIPFSSHQLILCLVYAFNGTAHFFQTMPAYGIQGTGIVTGEAHME